MSREDSYESSMVGDIDEQYTTCPSVGMIVQPLDRGFLKEVDAETSAEVFGINDGLRVQALQRNRADR